MANISWCNLLTIHQPIHGHFSRNLYRFYTVECSENAIPNTGCNTMVQLRLMKMMVEVMLSKHNENLSNRLFSVVTGVGIFV